MGIFADSNRVSLSYIQESNSTWGTTPTSGKVRAMRLNSSSLAASKTTEVSKELRADRMVSSIIETGAMSGGDVKFEYSAGSFDDFQAAFVLGAWTRPMTYDYFKGNTVAVTATNQITLSGHDYTDYLTITRRVKLEGFVSPFNLGYFQISGVTYDGANTLVTVSVSTLVVESGTAYTKMLDANDVIVLASTAIRSGTSSGSTFDSNGGNLFASAIAAEQLAVGQNVSVEGLGYESGTFTFSGTATNGDTVTVNDGDQSYTFVAGTDYAVGASATNSATALTAAINAKRPPGDLNVKATSIAGAVTVTNLNATGGTLSEGVDSGSVQTVVNFSGGHANSHGVYKITAMTSDILTVTPAPATINNSTLKVTVKGSMLRNPGQVDDITPQSFSIQTSYNDITQFMMQNGLRVGKFTLDVASGAIVTGAMSFEGKETTGGASTTLGAAGTHETGTIAYTGTAAADDTIIVNDGVHSPITYTAKASGAVTHEFNIGASATASATNLQASILADVASGLLALDVTRATATVTLRNRAAFTGGSVAEGVDSGSAVTVTNFSGGVLGYAQLDTTATEVMNATSDVGSLKKDGVDLVTAIKSITLEGNAGLRNQMAVGSKFPRGIGTGRFTLTGKVAAYFEDLTLWNEFLAHTTVALSFNFIDTDKNQYYYTLPALKFSQDPIGPGGIDQDIMEELAYTAFRDPNTACMIQVDRFSSTLAV